LIRYYIDGRERREKSGLSGGDINLYKIRKTHALRGVKLPINMMQKGTKFRVISQEAIDWYLNHDLKDVRNLKCRRMFIQESFGDGRRDQAL
jgi:hypothetical protein